MNNTRRFGPKPIGDDFHNSLVGNNLFVLGRQAMRHMLGFGFTLLVVGALTSTGCLPTSSPASGGASTAAGASGGAPASGGSSTGATEGAAGAGGSSVGSGGRGSGGPSGSGGSGTEATGGSASGGTSAGSGDRGPARTGGTPGSGGISATSAGSSGRDGTTGKSGASTGGATGAAAPAGDDYVSDVKVAVHPNTTTILVVTWTQLKTADNTLLEFSFSGSSVMTSRPLAGAAGSHRDVVLGVPEKTAVTVRIVSRLGGVDYKTKDYQGTTGALPSGIPKPALLAYDASLATPERWLLGAVENSTGGCSRPSCYYDSEFWIYIMDRQARIVWYWADPANDASNAYPRVALDGEYLVIDQGRIGKTGVVKMTLDRQYYETVAIAKLDDAIDVTADGSVLYDVMGDLKELTKAGTTRSIWSCRQTFPRFENCYSNTVNWNAADDTVLLSFPDDGTVVQIDRKTGTMVGQYGNSSGSYAFSPSSWKFQYPHSPNITPQGTLILSTHLPAYPDGTPAAPKHHAFAEFEIDRANKRLTEKWVYSDGDEWCMYKGFALRLANGNTLGNYGTGGVIREITPDKKTVFHVKFDVATGDDFNNKMVGNNLYVADLYALNGGGPK